MKSNYGRGPQVGNAGSPTKRKDFMAEKDKTSSYRSELAAVINNALGMRGRGQAASKNPALESLHDNTKTKRGPTKGNA